MNVFTQNRTSLALSDQALASGGEGAVYTIQGFPHKLIKIYNNVNVAKAKEEKIRAMVRSSESSTLKKSGLLNDISWPLAMIYDDKHNFIGFGMNAIGDGLKLDDIYAYPPKVNANITIIDKLDLLISMCNVVERFHDTGNEIGDFNPENIMINKNMTVGFIDVDSCHLHLDGKTYKCVVCAPGYVAPEIISKTKNTTYEAYNGTTFTKESDYFGLAIHCFCMLMNGCHPYKCVKHKLAQGSSASVMPIDLRVERGETPFFRNVPNMITPDWAPRLNDLPDYLVKMFERAFVEGHNNPLNRPNEKEWKTALLKYKSELKQCSNQRIHQYWKGFSTCPYCEALKRKPIKPNKTNGVNKVTKKSNITKNTVNNTVVTHQSGCGSNYKLASVSNSKAELHNKVFWVVTTVLIVLAQVGLLYGYYQYRTAGMFDGFELASTIVAWLTAAAGVTGTIMYNANWSNYARGGRIKTGDYFLSILCGAGFTICGAIALVIVAYVLYFIVMIVCYILVLVLIIAVFLSLLGG